MHAINGMKTSADNEIIRYIIRRSYQVNPDQRSEATKDNLYFDAGNGDHSVRNVRHHLSGNAWAGAARDS